MINKISNIIIAITISIITIIHSNFFNYFWININILVDWNFQFTKSIITNVLIWILAIIFFIKNFNKKIIIPYYVWMILIVFFYSIISSDFFYTNIFWNNIKWQWIIFFNSLVLLFIICINKNKKDIEDIIKYIIIFSTIPFLIAIKEYYIPSFNYWNLSNRAIWTFWHPNYLALYIIILIPIIFEKIKDNKFYIIILTLAIFTLLITKSLIAIIILLIYFLVKLNKIKNKKINYLLLSILIIISLYIIYKFGLITKLNSFISRFYIWETSLKIIFSDLKNIIFWVWNDSLIYLFEKYKSKELYLFENIWYSADRSHNIFIDMFYNYWLLWLSLVWFFIYKFKKKFKNNKYYIAILLSLFFLLFNIASVSFYLIFILIISFIVNKKYKKNYYKKIKVLFVIISIFSVYSSINYYIYENKIYYNKSINENSIYKKIYLENPENKIFENQNNIENICIDLTNFSQSIETYFYCWNSMYYSNREKSIYYYNLWLNKLPDMYNSQSDYYNNFLIKNIFNYDRFISEKYSNIQEILNRVNNNK